MHYIINGEDQGAFTKKLPFEQAPLYAVVDVYGTTKQVRIVQLYGGRCNLSEFHYLTTRRKKFIGEQK